MKIASIEAKLIESLRIERRRLHVHGVVQGVGFRPFVVLRAQSHHLGGWVRNTPMGVELEVQGESGVLDEFVDELMLRPPPLARILEVVAEPVDVRDTEDDELHILPSTESIGRTLVSPDVATCDACRREILDPDARRSGYAFTNCTHCGPRFTIIQELPYDRARTTMAPFDMCEPCRAEYADPGDRRFHAQPIACEACGPEVWLARVGGSEVDGGPEDCPKGKEAIGEAAATIARGGVVAIRGMGGFHLACAADDTVAVGRLRRSKFRPSKPFAVMMASTKEAERFCTVEPPEAALLEAPEAPIVLLSRRFDPDAAQLPEAVAPRSPSLGVMLPFTPLHHLLMKETDRPLVMTSGNRQGEPLCTSNEEALAVLSPFVDALLLHNRPIRRRCDDSVMMVAKTQAGAVTQPVRRSRGLAPLPVLLPPAVSLEEPVVAVGGELKNTAAVAVDRTVFLTQHVGDMETVAAREAHAAAISDLEELFAACPVAIACDPHPGYAATRYARDRAKRGGLPVVEVQHHHAHIAACMAENNRTDKVIGLSFDGTGYGSDGRIWGGEVLVADLEQFERRLHLEYLPLPGGDAAIRHPWRIALAYLHQLAPEAEAGSLFGRVPASERRLLVRMVEQGLNAMPTSSMGRLFDAVSALVGACREVTHEGQAAIALEALAGECTDDPSPYPFELRRGTIRLAGVICGVVGDLKSGRDRSAVALAFHRTVGSIAVAAAQQIRDEEAARGDALETVALSGGVWQNRLLLEDTVDSLSSAGFEVLLHHAVPPNDGGLAYGQAAVAAARLKRK